MTRTRALTVVPIAVLLAALFLGCAVNPATGKRQLVLISEADEIAIGIENDSAMVQSLGLYDNDALQEYVRNIGTGMASKSERPQLDWTFRVIDDPIVNAFALPGGFVYITRGILVHMNSEAELAGVIGHEIGHVTAQHGVNQMSKQQLAQLGMGLGMAVSEDFRSVADLASQGLGLLFLKYSRDDERQADDLGLRYMSREGYDPRSMADFYSVLREVSEANSDGGGAVPSLFSTHPQPENRRARLHEQIQELGDNFDGYPTGRDEFMRQIDGMVFGEDPRAGFFVNSVFKHPDLAFRFDFPDGWKTRNARSEVMAVGPDQDAMIRLTLAAKDTAKGSLEAFFAQDGIARGSAWRNKINGFKAASSGFTAEGPNGTLRGMIAFIEYEGRVYELLGITVADRWNGHAERVRGALTSFKRLTDPRALNVESRKIRVIRLGRDMSLQEFAETFNSSVSVETLALINQIEPESQLAVGQTYKVVRGGPKTP